MYHSNHQKKAPMFAFDKPTAVKLAHINCREERHGDESVAAIDLKFVSEAGNSQLAMLHPDLRAALYDTDDDERPGLDGIEPIATKLRFPAMLQFAWELEMTGCEVEVDYGLGLESNIVLADCKVNQFRVECRPGGTTLITFRVQTSNFPEGAVDKLLGKLGHETAITLEAPAAPAQGDLDLSTKPPAAANDPKAKTPEQALADAVK